MSTLVTRQEGQGKEEVNEGKEVREVEEARKGDAKCAWEGCGSRLFFKTSQTILVFAINLLGKDPASTKNQELIGGYDESLKSEGLHRAALHVTSDMGKHFRKRSAWRSVFPGVVRKTGCRATRNDSNARWHVAHRHGHRDVAG